jgi:hypothetical protein
MNKITFSLEELLELHQSISDKLEFIRFAHNECESVIENYSLVFCGNVIVDILDEITDLINKHTAR